MNEIRLNLTRKWRSQNFDQIIGQELSVKILKNSLYRGHLFPVYLFWGQRGTGKTSTARLFASAVNCVALPQFQKDPKNFILPCGQCPSCLAMLAGKHPDFIEIDAASHTGVDNVRQIIDSASFLPVIGSKKIYLIDESHMLSKAAFNALLKILEEPPISALFILATTDPQKIIDTVRSRCFQICFKPIESSVIINHLRFMCKQEAIFAESEALSIIAYECEGSARDAINMLEQVRFAQGRITKQAVLAVLGRVDDATLIKLLDILCSHDSMRLMNFIQESSLEQFNAEYLWKRIVELLRMMIWIRYGLSVDMVHDLAVHLTRLAKRVSTVDITQMLEIFYAHERLFAKTTGKYLLLEMLLLKICQWGRTNSEPSMNPVSQQAAVESCIADTSECELQDIEQDEQEDDSDDQDAGKRDNIAQVIVPSWDTFVAHIDKLDDPLLVSIFKNGSFRSFDQTTKKVEVAFAKQFEFFQDWINNSRGQWMPLMEKVFCSGAQLCPLYSEEIAPVVTHVRQPKSPNVPQEQIHVKPVVRQANTQPVTGHYSHKSVPRKPMRPIVDVSDPSLWPHASLIMRHIPGVVRLYQEG